MAFEDPTSTSASTDSHHTHFDDIDSDAKELIVTICANGCVADAACVAGTSVGMRHIAKWIVRKRLMMHRDVIVRLSSSIGTIIPPSIHNAFTEVMTTLVLSYNGIGPTVATVIAKALQGNRVLTDLNLYGNSILAEGATAIAQALHGNRVLKVLNIGFNNIGDEGASAIGDVIRGNMVLKNVNLLRNNITVEVAAPIVQLFRDQRHMQSLCGFEQDKQIAYLSNQGLGDVDAILLGADLEYNETLQVLLLNNNDFTDEGMATIADALRNNAVLKKINLLRNNTTIEGAAPLVRLFRERRHIESICGVRAEDTAQYYNTSNFSDSDAVLMAAELEFNADITKLDLWRNNITSEGAKAFASALRVNESLTHLDLSSNHIDEEGATALVCAMHVNKNLTFLDLGDNEICGINKDRDGASVVPAVVALADALMLSSVNGLAIVFGEESDEENVACFV